MSGGETLTVLRDAAGNAATKTFTWNPTLGQWLVRPFDLGWKFTAREFPVSSLADAVAAIERHVLPDSSAFVVSGGLAPETREAVARNPGHTLRRRKHTKRGVKPTLVEVERRLFCVDVDKWPLPPWADLCDDPEAIVDAAIHDLLPEPFHDAECWWQLSSSAGFKAGSVSMHLFFYASEPVGNAHLKRVMHDHAPDVDGAVYSATQPIYCAAPIIRGGHDPLPRRTGWRKGLEPVVHLPAPLPPAERPRAAPGGAGGGRYGSAEAALALLGHGQGRNGFHKPLRAATLLYARRVTRGAPRDDAAFKARLREAIRAAPCNADYDVEARVVQDFYLDDLIGGAFDLCAGEPEVKAAPPPPKLAGTVADDRTRLRDLIRQYMGRVVAWHGRARLRDPEGDPDADPAEHAAVAVAPGLGKSRAAMEALVELVAALKAAGLPHRVLWAVPHHRLSDEAVGKMVALGVRAAIWRGRDAILPGTPAPEEGQQPARMCLNQPAARGAVELGLNVETAACGSADPDKPRCPFRDACPFQLQKPKARAAEVVIVANTLVFHALPAAIGDGFGLVIADEAFWPAGLVKDREVPVTGFAHEPITHPVLRRRADGEPPPRLGRGWNDDEATARLHDLSLRLQRALEAAPDGAFLARQALLDAGLTVELCVEAHGLEWRRKRDDLVLHTLTEDQIADVKRQHAGNFTVGRRAALWRVAEALLRSGDERTGRVRLEDVDTRDGPARVALLYLRREVHPKLAALPLLHLDATFSGGVVGHFLPRLVLLARLNPPAGEMRLVQVLGAGSKSALVPSPKASKEDNAGRTRRAELLADFVKLHARGPTAVLTYKDIVGLFAAPGISTVHYGVALGINDYERVASFFQIGRPLANPRDTWADAVALTGKPIEYEEPRREARGVRLADGSTTTIEVRCYADPDLETVREAVTDAAVVQGLGRPRPLDRGAGTPLLAVVVADVVLPYPPHRVVHWDAVCPSVVERMAARGVVALSPVDALRLHPDLFPAQTRTAASEAINAALRAADFRQSSLYLSTLTGEIDGNAPRLVRYRPAGRGQQTRTLYAFPQALPGLRERLERDLDCTLALYEIADNPTPPTPPEPPPPPVAASFSPTQGETREVQRPVSPLPLPRPPSPPGGADRLSPDALCDAGEADGPAWFWAGGD